jgi:glycosyltransferase involved in cell wall biosynthesis
MKILHVITSLRTGGAEKLMLDLIPRLKAKGHEVDLLLFDGTDTSFKQQAEAAGIRVMHLRKGGSVYNPLNIIQLIPYLKKYDIVHTHNTAPQLFAAIGSLFGSAKLCTTEHNTSNRRRAWKWYAPIDRWMYNRYKQVICISKKTEMLLLDFIGCSRSRICTINNGIDISKFRNANPNQLLKHDSQNRKIIMMVAGFRFQKDQDTVIRALVDLPSEFHLFLIGGGERRQVCEQLVSELNLSERVHFLGIRDDVANLLKASDYVVMSSHWEGFGLAAVEGMAAGKPVIASDVDGLREVVEGAGLLFPYQDSQGLASQIKLLDSALEQYQAVVVRCRERAEQFDIEKMVEGYNQVYKQISND